MSSSWGAYRKSRSGQTSVQPNRATLCARSLDTDSFVPNEASRQALTRFRPGYDLHQGSGDSSPQTLGAEVPSWGRGARVPMPWGSSADQRPSMGRLGLRWLVGGYLAAFWLLSLVPVGARRKSWGAAKVVAPHRRAAVALEAPLAIAQGELPPAWEAPAAREESRPARAAKLSIRPASVRPTTTASLRTTCTVRASLAGAPGRCPPRATS